MNKSNEVKVIKVCVPSASEWEDAMEDAMEIAEKMLRAREEKKKVKVDEAEVHYLMWLHKMDTKGQIDAWVNGLKSCGDLENIANGMCAMNYLGWNFKDDAKKQEMWFNAYRKMQAWAYNGGLNEDDAANLYNALD